MWDRRRFLTRGAGLALGLTGGSLALRAFNDDALPDGSQARGMINPATQEAIDRGLAYLDREQQPNGAFGTGQYRASVAVTSLAGLALMSGGHQPGRGRYGRVVTRALQFVLDNEQQTYQALHVPGFLHNPASTGHGPMYGHGFATLFLAEAYGMVHNRELRERLRGTLSRAIQLIIRTQNHEGGWRYRPQPHDADLSVTICQIMALRAARNAGFAVPRKVADDCTKYVKGCQDLHVQSPTRGSFQYMKQGGHRGFALTAAGVVALYSAGEYKGEAVENGLKYLSGCRPGNPQNHFLHPERNIQGHYYYGHYYAVQAMWTAGGDYWREWYPAIRDELLSHQDYNRHDGSWFDRRTCPHFCTAMALIILQVPNNYLPILQR